MLKDKQVQRLAEEASESLVWDDDTDAEDGAVDLVQDF